VGETVSSTTKGCAGLSRQRWEEWRMSDPTFAGRKLIRCKNEVIHRGEM
jgi:hypothetical protein